MCPLLLINSHNRRNKGETIKEKIYHLCLPLPLPEEPQKLGSFLKGKPDSIFFP